MACIILTDQNQDISVYYCTTSDEPVAGVAFRGLDSREQAEDFWTFVAPRRDDDPRSSSTEHLRKMYAKWYARAFDDQDVFHPVAA